MSEFTDEELEGAVLDCITDFAGKLTTWKVWRFVWSRRQENVDIYRATLRLWRRGKIRLDRRLHWVTA